MSASPPICSMPMLPFLLLTIACSRMHMPDGIRDAAAQARQASSAFEGAQLATAAVCFSPDGSLARADADQLQRAVQDSWSRSDIEGYLVQWPGPPFAEQARARLADFAAEEEAVTGLVAQRDYRRGQLLGTCSAFVA
ncbi:MAG: hypothetical protein ACI8PZ_004781 [Myxococcota bacterium]|jgi:hypothetical protein